MPTTEENLSPLATVERRVQQRAAEVALDMDAPGAEQRLRQLIEREIEGWTLEQRRGTATLPLADPVTVAERAFRNLAGYGPLQPLLG
jgi:hypothetical protein